MSERVSLGELPPSDDEYWDHAKKELHVEREFVECKHEFEQMTARDIRCKHCGAGLFIGMGDVLKDGHLYHDNKRVI